MKKKNSITIDESELVGMIMFNHKEESKLNSTITANSCAHTLTHDQIIKKSPYNENNAATIKINKILSKIYY